MYLIVTRTFPPAIGGMQNLMWGLTRSFSKHHMVKVFADYADNHKKFDESVAFSIERIRAITFLIHTQTHFPSLYTIEVKK